MNSRKGEPLAVGDATMPLASRESLSQLFREHHRRVLTAAYRITGQHGRCGGCCPGCLHAHGKRSAARQFRTPAAIFTAPPSTEHSTCCGGSEDCFDEPLQDAAGIPTSGPGSSPETVVSNRELGGWLRLAISELPPRAAEMFSLRYVEELSNREIAALMGTSQAVVAVTLHHARSRLKKRLRELEQERP
jgi:RNA polymerase sigma factor (sigma-70 family)